MKEELNNEEARQLSNAGLMVEDYKIVKRKLKDRLVDALLLHSTFCTHAGFAIDINMTSEKSATVFSSKDRNEYRVEFELDAFDEPRITKITPIGRLEPNQEVIYEHLRQQRLAGIEIDEGDLTQLRTLNEQKKVSGARNLQLTQLVQQRGAGLLTVDEYFEQRDRLLLAQHKERTAGKKLLFEAGDSLPAKRAKIWEAQRRGEITIEQAAQQAAEIRVAEEKSSKPKWLMEGQSHGACDCADCDLADCRKQLDEAISTGQMSESAADRMWQARLAMD